MPQPEWLDWIQRLQAIANNGLFYAEDPFDTERYGQIRDIAAEITAAHTGSDLKIIQGLFAHDNGYITPKIDVRSAVFKGDTIILLVKEMADGLWTLPGGWADIGDSPAEAAERETREESGYEARAVKLMAAYDRHKHDHPPHEFHAYKLFFLCELTGGEAKTSYETTDVGFFREDDLPPLSVARVTAKQIARFFEHYRNPDLPTDFD